MKFKIKQLFKMLSQHIIFPFIYSINRWRQIDKSMVILADAHHDTCPWHMELLRKKLTEEHYDVRECYFNLSSHTNIQGMRAMLHFMKLYSHCGCVVICDNYLPVSSCRKRRGTRVIQLWHGSGAFKKFGYDAGDDIPAMYRGNVYRNYDIVTVSSEYCVQYFKSAMQITDNSVVRPLGVSCTDRIYDGEFVDSCRDRFRYEYPDAVGKKVVLWAPSFRGNAGMADAGGSFEIMGREQIKALGANQDLYIIESLHPHLMKGKSVAMTTEELMMCADVMITDYSSVFFEYLLLNRPIVFFAPDYEDYSDKRGYYLDYGELPGIIVKGKASLKAAVREAVYNDTEDMKKKRREFRERYMSACDGNATDRIMDCICNILK